MPGTTRAPWIIAAVVATVIAYVIGAAIAYGDNDRDPNVASFASAPMALLVVIAAVTAMLRRESQVPVRLSQLAVALGVVGVAGTLLAG